MENNTWVRGNTRFISSVEHDFQASMYFSVYYIKDSTRKAIISTEKR
jgi:hypothetical protein